MPRRTEQQAGSLRSQGLSCGVPPVLIPNTEVKPTYYLKYCAGDGMGG